MISDAKGHKMKVPVFQVWASSLIVIGQEVLIGLPNYTGDRYFH